MERSRRHWWKVAASLALAAGLLAWFLSRVPLADVVRTLATVRLGWFGAAIVASLSSYALRALRWRVILRPLGNAPTAELLGCTAAGFATSAILPARAGELVRPLLLSARTRLPAAGTVASIVVERLADLATVLMLFAVGLTEAQAKERGYDIKIGRFPFQPNGKALGMGDYMGFVKIVMDAKYGEILGAHMIGPEVTELLPELTLARMMELTPHEIARNVHAHPTLSEAIMEAAHGADGSPIHI